MEHETSLRDALSYDGDLELRFQNGEAIPIHSQKLKLASSVLRDLITAVLDDLIASSAAKRRRTAEGSSNVTDQQQLPILKVSPVPLDMSQGGRALVCDRYAHGPFARHGPICTIGRQCPCTNAANPG